VNNQQIILFDGVCNFCNFWVNFIIDRDKRDMFKFAALQSEIGRDLLERFKLDSNSLDTFVLIEEEKVYTKSTAALKISRNLKGIWKYLYFMIFIPKPVRDYIYTIIARNRYKFFGKLDACRVPSEQEKSKFLAE
jgi:predicted DCC family thiol-disulfide oxidoreductase YuxK